MPRPCTPIACKCSWVFCLNSSKPSSLMRCFLGAYPSLKRRLHIRKDTLTFQNRFCAFMSSAVHEQSTYHNSWSRFDVNGVFFQKFEDALELSSSKFWSRFEGIRNENEQMCKQKPKRKTCYEDFDVEYRIWGKKPLIHDCPLCWPHPFLQPAFSAAW